MAVDKFCLHLNKKWKGKKIFNEIKKEIFLHRLFPKLRNYSPTKSPALQYTSANAARIFEIRP
jgi:hypothetical protein